MKEQGCCALSPKTVLTVRLDNKFWFILNAKEFVS